MDDKTNMTSLSQICLLTSKISHVCQEICDIKKAKKPKSHLSKSNYTSTSWDEGRTDLNYTLELDNNSSAKEGSDGGDGWDDVRKLDLLHLCFSSNFYFLIFPRNFPLCFPY